MQLLSRYHYSSVCLCMYFRQIFLERVTIAFFIQIIIMLHIWTICVLYLHTMKGLSDYTCAEIGCSHEVIKDDGLGVNDAECSCSWFCHVSGTCCDDYFDICDSDAGMFWELKHFHSALIFWGADCKLQESKRTITNILGPNSKNGINWGKTNSKRFSKSKDPIRFNRSTVWSTLTWNKVSFHLQ